jgi:hypothetical protein
VKKSSRVYLQFLAPLLLLGLVCFIVYNANLRQIDAGDTWPARYLPLILWRDGTLELDAQARLVARGHSLVPGLERPADPEGKITYFEPWAYWLVRTPQDQLASLYPVVTPLLVAPLYLPAVVWLNANGWEQPQLDHVAEIMEKLAASILAATATVLMYLVLRRDGSRWSLPFAVVFAFGTNTWMISSQALWQHGTGELLIALALLLALVRASPGRTALLGAVCVLMAANRPPDALIAAAFVLYIVWSCRRDALWLLVGAAAPLAALLYYNLGFIGDVLGGYALGQDPNVSFVRLDWSGVAGLLVSPARGLLVFSPFLVFLPVGFMQRLRAPGTEGLAVALSVGIAAQVLLYSQTDWRGGVSWGPRWLTDILPILVWMVAPAPLVLRPFGRGLLILAMAASIGVQTVGAFWYTGTSDARIFAGGPADMRGAWNPRNVPFLVVLRHGPADPELLDDARGWLDRVGLTLVRSPEDAPRLEPGAVIEGWALTGGRTPAQLFVLIDGIIIGATSDFFPRGDVNAALGTTAPSGWRIFANTEGVQPGERLLQLAVRVGSGGNIRIVRDQRVFVVTPEPPATPQMPANGNDIDAMAASAAFWLREHQAEDGYWLTAHTQDLRYEAPLPEMNTFLAAMLFDLLAPIASQHSLDHVVERARQHLAAQIEGSGLVRYHGLPDAPTIGVLGCVITPDADDTALAWRIAGPGADDPRWQPMLAELARYRDARGLYRTWLAPQDEYQCINPGRDPNPADLTIQMNIYLMLRELDSPAAHKLCAAIQRSFGDDDHWVYYAKAPLLPYLRSAELNQLGCALPLPAERLATAAPGQEIWSEAGSLLLAALAVQQDPDVQQAVRELLVRIGSNDFAQLRRSPPLLYHNDLTASVSRFYWSEDFGYALWLRLYAAVGAEAGQLR